MPINKSISKKVIKKYIFESLDSNEPGMVENIEQLTENNNYFRKVIYTAKNNQLVVMALNPSEDIGSEVHYVDQFMRIEEGNGICVINDKEYEIENGTGIIIPSGAKHNIVNTGNTKLKLYTIYSPPHHKDGTIHKTKNDAKKDEEHFDNEVTKNN